MPTRTRWKRITRSTLFWPSVLLVVPRLPRLAAVVVLAVSPASQAAEDLAAAEARIAAAADICEEEHIECEKYCSASYNGDPGRERTCLELCDENYDTCVYEVYGDDEGCETDPETTEAIACGVATGAGLVCEAAVSEGCDASCEADDGLGLEGDDLAEFSEDEAEAEDDAENKAGANEAHAADEPDEAAGADEVQEADGGADEVHAADDAHAADEPDDVEAGDDAEVDEAHAADEPDDDDEVQEADGDPDEIDR